MEDSRSPVRGVIAALLLATLAGWLAASRSYFSFGTETDFLGGFISEAARILEGRAPLVDFHPPLYSLAVAFVQFLLHDWFAAGRLLSIVSAAGGAAAAFLLFRRTLSESAGWGALTAMALSPLFLTYAALASSDMFFLALFLSALWLAFEAAEQDRPALWGVAGLAIGLGMLSRSNAITLLPLLALPLLSGEARGRGRWKSMAAVAAGFAAPLLLWGVVATFAGSPFLPSGLVSQLAYTYFPTEPGVAWADSADTLDERFGSLLAVLLHDPAHLAFTYLRDLYYLPYGFFAPGAAVAFPINLLLAPALLILLSRLGERRVQVLLALIALQLLLVNLKTYELRFYLFLIPFLGAAGGDVWSRLTVGGPVSRSAPRLVARLPQWALAGSLALALVLSVRGASHELQKDEEEIGASVEALRAVASEGTIVIARKPPLAYHAGVVWEFMPPGSGPEELLRHAQELTNAGPVLIYMGSSERGARPEYRSLVDPASAPAGLELVDAGTGPSEWVLYRLR